MGTSLVVKLIEPSTTVGRAALAFVFGATAAVLSRLLVPDQALPGPWLASAVLSAVLLHAPRRSWAALLGCGFAAVLGIDLASGATRDVAIAGAAGGAAETLVAAFAIRWFVRGRPLSTANRILAVLGVSTAVASPVGYLLASGVGLIAGVSGAGEPARCWLAAHAFAMIVVLPLGLSTRTTGAEGRRAALHWVLLLTALAPSTVEIFLLPHSGRHSHPYLVGPLLAAAALRFHVRGASIAGALVAVAATWGTSRHGGEFAIATNKADNLVDVFLFVGVALSTSLVLAATLEQSRVEAGRAKHNADRSRALLREFELFLHHAPLPIYVKDARSRFVAASAALASITARTRQAIVGKPIDQIWPPEIASMLRREDVDVLEQGRVVRGTLEYRGRCYETFNFPIGSGPTARIGGFLVDVTERRQAEQALRLASVGTLASGVAHEVNNPLAVIVSNVTFMEGELTRLEGAVGADRVGEMRAAAAEVLESAGRVRRIVHDLRRLSCRDDSPETLLNPRVAVSTALELAGAQIRSRAELVERLGSAPSIAGSERDVAQAVVSVLVNAAEALTTPDGRSHRVVVELTTDANGWALIEVSDSGRGISADELPRVFDPFFTTKDIGTGLGLSVANAIVRRLGGIVEVVSSVGRGTSVRLRLPPAGRGEPVHVSAPRPSDATG